MLETGETLMEDEEMEHEEEMEPEEETEVEDETELPRFVLVNFQKIAEGSIYNPWNIVKKAFSCFGNVRNRFPA